MAGRLGGPVRGPHGRGKVGTGGSTRETVTPTARSERTQEMKVAPARSAAQTDTRRLRRLQKFLWRCLGVFSLLNIVAHSQSLVQLSDSVHTLALWWNYFTAVAFGWLGIHVSLIARHIIVVVAVALSSANIGHFYRHRRLMLVDFVRAIAGDKVAQGRIDFYKVDLHHVDSIRGNPLGWAGLASAMALFFFLAIMYIESTFGKALLAYTLPTIGVFLLSDPRRKPRLYRISPRVAYLILAAFLLYMPLILVVLLFMFAFQYWKEMLKTAGLLVAIIALDQALQLVVTPLAGVLTNIPRPPGTE